MKKSLMAVALAASTAIAAAQATSVTLVKVLDTQVSLNGLPDNGALVGSSTYVPVADKFIVGTRADDGIQVFNSLTGAYETNMSHAGVTPSGLGFFGATATQDGVVYVYEDGGKDIWRWGSVSDPAPQKVYDTALFARTGATGKVGNDVAIAFTGSNATGGNVQFFSDTFPFSSSSFAFNETVNLLAKPSIAINNAGTVAFTVKDTNNPLQKWIKTDGVWSAAPVWSKTFNGGPIAYDNVHDVVIGLGVSSTTAKKLMVFDGATGNLLGETTVTTSPNATPQCSGGWITPTLTGGTVYLSAPAAVSPLNAVAFYVYTYVIPNAGVDDWSLYKQ